MKTLALVFVLLTATTAHAEWWEPVEEVTPERTGYVTPEPSGLLLAVAGLAAGVLWRVRDDNRTAP